MIVREKEITSKLPLDTTLPADSSERLRAELKAVGRVSVDTAAGPSHVVVVIFCKKFLE